MPVYNEAENIERALRALQAAVKTPHEVLVVHDSDEDSTLPVVRALQPEMTEVRLVRNALGPGVLNALKAGFRVARGDLVLVTMADGSDDLGGVDAMVQLAREGADVVAASRYVRGGRQVGGPRLKGLLSRAAGLSLHAAGVVPIHDATNNFKLYRRRFLHSVRIESRAGFELALELSVKAALSGRRFAEIPTVWHDRTAGESRFRLRAWLPHYLRWYAYGLRGRVRQLRQRG